MRGRLLPGALPSPDAQQAPSESELQRVTNLTALHQAAQSTPTFSLEPLLAHSLHTLHPQVGTELVPGTRPPLLVALHPNGTAIAELALPNPLK